MTSAFRDLPAWGISLIVNISILAAFHFIVLQSQLDKNLNTIESVVDTTEEEYDFSEAVNEDQIGTDGDSLSLSPAASIATQAGPNDVKLEEKIDEILNPEVANISDVSMIKPEGDLAEAVEVKGQSENITAKGVEGAMDRVTYEIRQSLHERKTLVVWMFDASGSLEERREKIADRFENIYKQLGLTGTTEGLYSAVVSFGKSNQLLTPDPLQDISKLSEVVRTKIEEDKSGAENVFSAAKNVVEKFRTWRRFEGPWNKLVFIVTDERGDDAQYLEDVISLAKRSQTKFFTVGNAAIFGRKEGYVKWTYDDGFEDYIAVDQGPESAFPDGVQLPFVGAGQDWRMRQMSASYGPYALTRLCAETGGMYLITEETRGHKFDRSVMRLYAPDYRPVRVQDAEIKRNAAKSALVAVAQMTYDSNLPVPDLTFRGYNDNILRGDITEAQRPVAEIDYRLKRMYDVLAAGEGARASLREARWQAAFDLAMGRILAMRVRYAGYNQMLANMKVNPKTFESENGNMWRLVPSSEIATGPQFRKASEQAKEYLKRVVDEHAGTPWALLAERELANDLGWSWEEYSEPIPGTNMLRGSDEEVARLLLADEERRERERAQRAKPRNPPNL